MNSLQQRHITVTDWRLLDAFPNTGSSGYCGPQVNPLEIGVP
jgi:hypothetical protein